MTYECTISSSQISRELNEKGICKIKFPDSLADELDRKYFYTDRFIIHKRYSPLYNRTFKELSLADPLLGIIFLHSEILFGIKEYYRSEQPYIRDLFAVTTHTPLYGYFRLLLSPTMLVKKLLGERAHAANFHTDFPSSIGLMLLVNDISENDTHMEFVTNKKLKPETYGLCDSDFYKRDCEIFKCIGERGTLFVFDNGNHPHKACMKSGCTRKTLHCIIMKKEHFIYRYRKSKGEPRDADFEFLTSGISRNALALRMSQNKDIE